MHVLELVQEVLMLKLKQSLLRLFKHGRLLGLNCDPNTTRDAGLHTFYANWKCLRTVDVEIFRLTFFMF